MTLIVASQLGEALDRRLAEAVPDIAIRPLERGYGFVLPDDAQVLIHLPGLTPAPVDAPQGWPGSLRWIQLVTTGIDSYPHWLLDAATVCNAAGPAGGPLAEYALAAILAASKGWPDTWTRSAESWNRSEIRRVEGSTLGIYGFGHVGRRLAEIAQALGMTVQATRFSDTPLEVAGVRRAADIAELLATSDHVVLAAPATAQTWHAVNRDTLRDARPGLHIVNVARGTLIDDDALLEAISDGRVHRASLDTTEPEPLPAGHPFYAHPQIFLTPHNANAVPDFFETVLDICVSNLHRYLAGDALKGIVPARRGY